MKHFIASALFTFAIGFQASAKATSDQDLYDLANIDIAKDSHQLPPQGQVASGALTIDRNSKAVTLSFERDYYCPAGTVCTSQMPAPVVIKLPIIHRGTGFCGGEVITAEIDNRASNGTYTSITIFNDNGNLCQPKDGDKAFVKPIKVEFTEQASRVPSPTVSTMDGVVKGTL